MHKAAAIQESSRKLLHQLGMLMQQLSPLSSSQYQTLLELHSYTTMNMLQLATFLNLDQSTTSRLVAQLVQDGLCKLQPNRHDRRSKLIALTGKGATLAEKLTHDSAQHIQKALACANSEQYSIILQGLSLYTHLLQKSTTQKFTIRHVLKKDSYHLERFYNINQVESARNESYPLNYVKRNWSQFLTRRPSKKGRYFVVSDGTEIVGHGSYKLSSPKTSDVCLMLGVFLLTRVRGMGLGAQLMEKMLSYARKDGFKICYIEDFNAPDGGTFFMKFGFAPVEQPAFLPKHTIKNQWYVKTL